MLFLYTNADCLPNKLHELKHLIVHLETSPDIISLTEIKHKHKWEMNSAELIIDGYQMFTNDLEANNRGILVYVKEHLSCKQIFISNNFGEYVLLQLDVNNNQKLNIATIYRSPNSSQENNTKMSSLINDICKKQGNTLILGDFNLPHIDWKTWNTTGSLECTFVDTLRKNFLYQHIDTPTRARGTSIRSSYNRRTIYRKY